MRRTCFNPNSFMQAVETDGKLLRSPGLRFLTFPPFGEIGLWKLHRPLNNAISKRFISRTSKGSCYFGGHLLSQSSVTHNGGQFLLHKPFSRSLIFFLRPQNPTKKCVAERATMKRKRDGSSWQRTVSKPSASEQRHCSFMTGFLGINSKKRPTFRVGINTLLFLQFFG